MNSEIVSFMQQLGIAASYLPVIYWSVVTLVIICVIYLSNVLCHGVIIPLVRQVTRKTQVDWDDTILNDNVLKTACALVPPVILIILLPIFFSGDNALNVMSLKACNVYVAIVTVKLMCTILTSLYILSSQHEKLKNRSLKGVFQMLKLVVICVGVIIVISELMDKDPVKIIAGFGASAAILMLVFKDTIMGLVAGVQLSINDMLRPGDWITIPKFGADGAVVEVTLTTVKVHVLIML